MTTFQDAVLDALVEQVPAQTRTDWPLLRIVTQANYSNTGILHVLHGWDEVVHIAYNFQFGSATLVIDHKPHTYLGGPSSDTVFHLDASDGTETKRLIAAWRARLQKYRDAWAADNPGAV